MATFSEVQKEFSSVKGRAIALRYLADLLEKEFLRINPEEPPKQLLLMDDGTPVAQEILDEVIEFLLKEVAVLDENAQGIMESTVQKK